MRKGRKKRITRLIPSNRGLARFPTSCQSGSQCIQRRVRYENDIHSISDWMSLGLRNKCCRGFLPDKSNRFCLFLHWNQHTIRYHAPLFRQFAQFMHECCIFGVEKNPQSTPSVCVCVQRGKKGRRINRQTGGCSRESEGDRNEQILCMIWRYILWIFAVVLCIKQKYRRPWIGKSRLRLIV